MPIRLKYQNILIFAFFCSYDYFCYIGILAHFTNTVKVQYFSTLLNSFAGD